MTRSWVLALDATYRHGANTHIGGHNIADVTSARDVVLNSGATDAAGLAPAIEYSWNSSWGVLFGTRFIPTGRNTSATITPAIAINFVH